MWLISILKNREIEVILLLFSIVFSCTKNTNNNLYDKTFILGKNEYKVWLVQPDSITLPGGYYFYFDKDSNCIQMIRDLRGKMSATFQEFPLEDIVLPNKWYLRNDSLFINEYPYEILRKVKDTIILRCEGNDSTYRTTYLIDIGIPPKSIRKGSVSELVIQEEEKCN